GRVSIRVENRLIFLAWNFLVDSHRADEDKTFYSSFVHRRYDVPGLTREIPIEVRIDNVMPDHGGFECLPIQNVSPRQPESVSTALQGHVTCPRDGQRAS